MSEHQAIDLVGLSEDMLLSNLGSWSTTGSALVGQALCSNEDIFQVMSFALLGLT